MGTSHYTIRNYRPSDFEDYVKLKMAAEKLHPIQRCSSRQVISESLGRPNYSPEKDIFVVEVTGKIVGFMDITPELYSRRIILDCLVHPEHRGQGLARKLLGCALRHAKKLGAEVARINIGQNNEVAKAALTRLGFRAVRRFLDLRLPLADIQLPDVAHSYACRHLQTGEEDKLTQIQNRSFAATWEYNPNTTEEIAYYINLSYNSPEDVILVYQRDKPVAYCWTNLNYKAETANNERKGRILMLGVDPSYRGRGIGRVALVAGLTYLKNKGVQVAEITVDSENEVARALYHSVGFRDWSSSLWYEKVID